VNLASRLEQANKIMGTRTLVSERTVQLSRSRFLVRPIGLLRVPGRRQAEMAYEPLAEMHHAEAEQRALAGATRGMVEAYIAGDFDRCLAAAAELARQTGRTKLVELYQRLCRASGDRRPDEPFEPTIVLETVRG